MEPEHRLLTQAWMKRGRETDQKKRNKRIQFEMMEVGDHLRTGA